MSEIVHHKYLFASKVHIAAVKAQCPLNQGGDRGGETLPHQLCRVFIGCVSVKDDVMVSEKKKKWK